MYEIKFSSKFKKSYKRILGSGRFDRESFDKIFHLLELNKDLDDQYHDHALKGDFSGLHECHISGNCLLLYEVNNTEKYVRFVNIGNHANIFE